MITCLLKDCDKPARDRGLCHNHANGMRYHIKLGNMTWTDLEMHGLALPKRQAGRKRTQTMVDAIEQVQKVSQTEPVRTQSVIEAKAEERYLETGKMPGEAK